MKKIIQWFKNLFFPTQTVNFKTFSGRQVMYSAEFVNRLTSEQMGLLLQNSINYFPPNCKPNMARVGGNYVSYSFSENCLNSDKLISIIDKTLERTQPKASVASVTISC